MSPDDALGPAAAGALALLVPGSAMTAERIQAARVAMLAVLTLLTGCTGDPVIDTMGRTLCAGGVIAVGVATLNPFAISGGDLCQFPR